MKLIADSGSTKTDWCIGDQLSNCHVMQTEGINPFHQSPDGIRQVIVHSLLPQLQNATEITEVFFYGAGCIPAKTDLVQRILSEFFPQARIEVYSDLLGAARSLCGREAGVACILGTGSNSCAYDGQEIIAHTPPLGYILGDEGSGTQLGKRLLSDCLKQLLPTDLRLSLLETYQLTSALILEKVYQQPFPHRFMASLTPFLSTNRKRAEIRTLLIDSFTQFLLRNVMSYPYIDKPIHFTGSIAYHFREELSEAAQSIGLSIGHIQQAPINGLKNYHLHS